MKKAVAAILALFIMLALGVSAAEGLPLDKMSDDELIRLRDDIDAELRSRMTEIPAGKYTVGDEIKAGEYVFYGKEALSSYLIEADGFADVYSVLGTFEIIMVSDGQRLTLTEAYAVPYPLAALPTLSESKPLGAGMYEAGRHFPVGSVTLRLTGALGAYTVYSAPRGTEARALSFRMFTDETVTFNVSEGEFLLFSGCELISEEE